MSHVEAVKKQPSSIIQKKLHYVNYLSIIVKKVPRNQRLNSLFIILIYAFLLSDRFTLPYCNKKKTHVAISNPLNTWYIQMASSSKSSSALVTASKKNHYDVFVTFREVILATILLIFFVMPFKQKALWYFGMTLIFKKVIP